MHSIRFIVLIALILVVQGRGAAQAPLPSWNEGTSKQAILDFIARVNHAGSPDFVPVDDRIAVLDNDGTMWAEQPVYVQMFFGLDRLKTLAPQHPEWKDDEPFASLRKGDMSLRVLRD